jgi:hypothetical protein
VTRLRAARSANRGIPGVRTGSEGPLSPISMDTGGIFPGLKRLGRGSKHSMACRGTASLHFHFPALSVVQAVPC